PVPGARAGDRAPPNTTRREVAGGSATAPRPGLDTSAAARCSVPPPKTGTGPLGDDPPEPRRAEAAVVTLRRYPAEHTSAQR
ncbi:hypothetical protein ACFXHK_36150, partial [Embleya sp. NPDC059267]